MEKTILFHLTTCPYCINAKRALSELIDENPSYGNVEIEWIEENEHPEISRKFNYYYVPTIFYGDKKLYEARPHEPYEECKANLRSALDTILGD